MTNGHRNLQSTVRGSKANWERVRVGTSTFHHRTHNARPSPSAPDSLQVLKTSPQLLRKSSPDFNNRSPTIEAFLESKNAPKTLCSHEEQPHRIHCSHGVTISTEQLKKFVDSVFAHLSKPQMEVHCICHVFKPPSPMEPSFVEIEGCTIKCPHGVSITALRLVQFLQSYHFPGSPNVSPQQAQFVHTRAGNEGHHGIASKVDLFLDDTAMVNEEPPLIPHGNTLVEPYINNGGEDVMDSDDEVNLEVVNVVKPRSKKEYGPWYELTTLDLAEHFELRLVDAAKRLDVSPTSLKKACRKFMIPRWPGRKV